MSNTNLNNDFEFATRLQLHDQGITNEQYIDNYIKTLRDNDYDLSMIYNPFRNFEITNEEFQESLRYLINYRFLDNYNTINTRDYSISISDNNLENPFQQILNNLNNSNYLNSTINTQLSNIPLGDINNNQITYQYPGLSSISSFEINNNNNNNTFSSGFLQSILSTIMTPIQEDVIVPLSNHSINNLNNNNKYSYEEFIKILNEENLEIDPACSICQTSFDDEIINYGDNLCKKDNIIRLDCEHYFHASCINRWLTDYNHTCPICKSECGETDPKI